MFYLWVDGEGFVKLAYAEEVIDDLLHGKVQSFLASRDKGDNLSLKREKEIQLFFPFRDVT